MSILEFWNPDVNFHENMTQTSENKKQFWNPTRIHTDIRIKKVDETDKKSSMKTTRCFKIPENCAKGNSKRNFQEQNRNKTIHTNQLFRTSNYEPPQTSLEKEGKPIILSLFLSAKTISNTQNPFWNKRKKSLCFDTIKRIKKKFIFGYYIRFHMCR